MESGQVCLESLALEGARMHWIEKRMEDALPLFLSLFRSSFRPFRPWKLEEIQSDGFPGLTAAATVIGQSVYRDRLKDVVARNFFLLLLNFSA